MLAMNKFVTLLDEDLLNTRNKPKELPNSAMMKITAYADVMPIFRFVWLEEFKRTEFGPWVTLVPKRRRTLVNACLLESALFLKRLLLLYNCPKSFLIYVHLCWLIWGVKLCRSFVVHANNNRNAETLLDIVVYLSTVKLLRNTKRLHLSFKIPSISLTLL